MKTLDLLESFLGPAAAQKVVEALGGQIIYFPASGIAAPELVEKIGADIAGKLTRAFAGERIFVPMAARRRSMREAILYLAEKDRSVAEIARALGCTTVYVYQVLHRMRAAI